MTAPGVLHAAGCGHVDPYAAWRRYCTCRPLRPPDATASLVDRLVGIVYSLSVSHADEYYVTRADLVEELELGRLLDALETRGFDRDRLEAETVILVHRSLAAQTHHP